MACRPCGCVLDRHQPISGASLHASRPVRPDVVLRRASDGAHVDGSGRHSCRNSGLPGDLVGTRDQTGEAKPVYRLERWPEVRLNDARADRRGSLWLGSMRNNVNADGSAGTAGGRDGVLCRLDPDASVTQWCCDIGIANTLAWSPDGGRFYFGDTLDNVIWVYDFDPGTGAIGNRRPFLQGYPRGLPDGSCMDARGICGIADFSEVVSSGLLRTDKSIAWSRCRCKTSRRAPLATPTQDAVRHHRQHRGTSPRPVGRRTVRDPD